MSVLDASAVLALLYAEPGAESVAARIAAGAALGAVNLAEVATALARANRDAAALLAPLLAQVELVSFEAADAFAVAALGPATAPAGLSLGDRACLALAQRLGVPAVTADRAWSGLVRGVDIDVIR